MGKNFKNNHIKQEAESEKSAENRDQNSPYFNQSIHLVKIQHGFEPEVIQPTQQQLQVIKKLRSRGSKKNPLLLDSDWEEIYAQDCEFEEQRSQQSPEREEDAGFVVPDDQIDEDEEDELERVQKIAKTQKKIKKLAKKTAKFTCSSTIQLQVRVPPRNLAISSQVQLALIPVSDFEQESESQSSQSGSESSYGGWSQLESEEEERNRQLAWALLRLEQGHEALRAMRQERLAAISEPRTDESSELSEEREVQVVDLESSESDEVIDLDSE